MGKEFVAITWPKLVTPPHTAQVSSFAVTESTAAHLSVSRIVGLELAVAGFAATIATNGGRSPSDILRPVGLAVALRQRVAWVVFGFTTNGPIRSAQSRRAAHAST